MRRVSGWGRGRRAARCLALAFLLLAAGPGPDGAAGAERTDRWGWLGVRIRDLSEQEMEEISLRHGIREGFGALIVEVIDGTPAARAGIRTGDLVVAFGDRPVVETRALQRLVSSTRVGEAVDLTVLRAAEGRRGLSVVVGPMPEPLVAERVAAEFGFLVRDPDARAELGEVRPSAPPAVSAVLRGGRAEAAGLRAGDVLIEVNGRPVLSMSAVREVLAALPLEGPLPLTIRRGDEEMQVVIAGTPRR